MALSDPAVQALAERIAHAHDTRTPLSIRGGGTKAFYGGPTEGEPVDLRGVSGVSSYEPSELVVTVRAGTPLADLEAALAEQGQCLPFEPPRFAAGGTVGGMVAAGLSGPARATVGSVRDHVLGLTMLDGRGQLLSFGGQVMKNVAGYDVARLMAGSLGVLGLIVEVSLKVLPQPPARATLRFDLDEAAALQAMNTWAGQPLPLHATAWWEGTLVVRLAGAAAAVQAAQQQLGGERVDDALADGFWNGLRDQTDEFFASALKAVDAGATLWRLSLPSTAPAVNLSGEQLIEWGGAQRWLCTTTPAPAVRSAAESAGGHATVFRSREPATEPFAPLTPPLLRIHRELKRSFDPAHILNPGRLVPGL